MNLPTKEEWERVGDLLSDIITDNPDEATSLYQLMTVARAIADGRLVVCERVKRTDEQGMHWWYELQHATTIPEET